MKRLTATLLVVSVLFSGCSLFQKDPQEAVNEGVKEFAQVKRASSLTKVSGIIHSPAGETPAQITFDFEVQGQADSTNQEEPRFDVTMKVNVGVDDKKGSAEIQVRSLNKKLFLKLNSLSLPGQPAELEEQLKTISQTWWNIPMEDTPFGKLNEEQKGLQEKLKNLTFFENAAEDGPEVVQGMDGTRYRVDLNKEAVKELLVEISRLGGQIPSPEEQTALADALSELSFSGVLTIGEDDALHRVRSTVSVQPTQGASSSFDIDYQGWDYGEKFELAEPADAREFSPLLLLPLMSTLGSLSAPAEAILPAEGDLGAEQTPESTEAEGVPAQ
ncbi:hypothetical protein CO046_04710 [Candidatus Peregrinibacteria bacterium CG_4_9_14_0_2_um_filter_53_11]|nr:MAG: hypothetical protein CO046_04710 [Candidatus Peregrinibacteria bacterium CG_4_9_14_0_2_um_filter_53_11]